MMLHLWLSAWQLKRDFINVVSSFNFQDKENEILYALTCFTLGGIPIYLSMFIFMPEIPRLSS